jgi:hypothetical protein
MKYLLLFENFICESKNEVPLQWSKDFESILYDMSNPLAYELFKNRLKPESITLLDITMDGEFISYIPADKFLKKLNIDTSNWNLLLTMTRTLTNNDAPIYSDGSVKTRSGRVFRKLFPDATAKEIEDLTNEYKSKFTPKHWEIFEGSDISIGYQSKNYSFNGRSSNPLMNSCMNDVLDLIKYYQYLPVKLLVLKNEEGHILGRALVWKIENGYLMDRIYTINDKDYHNFIDYAKDSGWWWKSENKSGGDIPYTNGKETKWFPIKIKSVDISQYRTEISDSYYGFPYMDTFCYAYGGVLSNEPPKEGGYLHLIDTDGYPEYINETLRDVHGDLIYNPDDYVWSNTQGGLISLSNAQWVEYVGFNDYIETRFLRQRSNGFIKDEENGRWFRIKDCQFQENGDIIYPEL